MPESGSEPTDPTEPTDPVEPTKDNLEALIADAEELLDATEPSEDGVGVGEDNYWAAEADIEAFELAIGAAQEVFDDEEATEEDIDAAIAALQAAIDAFEDARELGTPALPIEPTKDNLEALIGEATDLLDATEPSEDGTGIDVETYWATEADIEVFELAIEAAQEVFDDEEATEEDIDAAILALQDAIDAFEDARELGEEEVVVPVPAIAGLVIKTNKTAEITFEDIDGLTITEADFTLAVGGIDYTYTDDLAAVNDTATKKHYTVSAVASGKATITLFALIGNQTEWVVTGAGQLEGSTASDTFLSAGQQEVNAEIEKLDAAVVTLYTTPTEELVKGEVDKIIDTAKVTSVVEPVPSTTSWKVTLTHITETTVSEFINITVYAATSLEALNGQSRAIALTSEVPSTVGTATAYLDDENKLHYKVGSAAAASIQLDSDRDKIVLDLLRVMGSAGEGNSFTVNGGKITKISLTAGTMDMSEIQFGSIGIVTTASADNVILNSNIVEVTLPTEVKKYTLKFAVESSDVVAGSGNNLDILTATGTTTATVAITMADSLTDGINTFGKENSEVFTINTREGSKSYSVSFSGLGKLNFGAFFDSIGYPTLAAAVSAAVEAGGGTVYLGADVLLTTNITVPTGVVIDCGTSMIVENASNRITISGGEINAVARAAADGATYGVWYGDIDEAVSSPNSNGKVITLLDSAEVAATADCALATGAKLVVPSGFTLTVGKGTSDIGGLDTTTGTLELEGTAKLVLKGELTIADTDNFITNTNSVIEFANNGAALVAEGVTSFTASGLTAGENISIKGWVTGGVTSNATVETTADSATLLLTGGFAIGTNGSEASSSLTIEEGVTLQVGDANGLAASGTGVLVVGGELIVKGTLDISAGVANGGGTLEPDGDLVGTVRVIGENAVVKYRGDTYIGAEDSVVTLTGNNVELELKLQTALPNAAITIKSGTLTVNAEESWDERYFNVVVESDAKFVVDGEFAISDDAALTIKQSGEFKVNVDGLFVLGDADVTNNGAFIAMGSVLVDGLANLGDVTVAATGYFEFYGADAVLMINETEGSGCINPVIAPYGGGMFELGETGAVRVMPIGADATRGFALEISGRVTLHDDSFGAEIWYNDKLTIKTGATFIIADGQVITIEANGQFIIETGAKVQGAGSIILVGGAKVTDTAGIFGDVFGSTVKTVSAEAGEYEYITGTKLWGAVEEET